MHWLKATKCMSGFLALGLLASIGWQGFSWFNPAQNDSLRAPDASATWPGAVNSQDREGDNLLAALGLNEKPKQALAFLAELSVPVSKEKLDAALTDLSADDFDTRQKAQALLSKGGLAALPLLAKLATSEDPELVRRAEACTESIRQTRSPLLVAAMGRLFEKNGVAEGVEALLALGEQVAPEEDALFDTLSRQLAALRHAGLGEANLVGALSDKVPNRRALAGFALGASPQWVGKVIPLLEDPDKRVRVYSSWGLVQGGRREGMPVLVRELAEAHTGLREEVVEYLYQLAGDTAPDGAWGPGEEERKSFTATWENWWLENNQKIGDLHLGPRPFLDRTLVVYLDAGEVAVLDSNDKDVWRIRRVDFPLDAEPLPGNRVLLAENQGGRVSIRSRTGRILWQYAVESPIVAQSLPGGRIFVATRTEMFEVDRQGNRVREWKRPRGEVIMRASALPDGGVALVTFRQRFLRLDAAGEVVSNFPVMVSTTGGRVDVAPDGRVLIPMMHQDLVLELDAQGQDVRRFMVREPIVAQRQPNGHVMITSMEDQKAIEFDAAGRVVWEYRSPTSRVTRAIRY